MSLCINVQIHNTFVFVFLLVFVACDLLFVVLKFVFHEIWREDQQQNYWNEIKTDSLKTEKKFICFIFIFNYSLTLKLIKMAEAVKASTLELNMKSLKEVLL